MSADAAKAAFEVIRDRMADGGAVEKRYCCCYCYG